MTLGLNMFADLSSEEFSNIYLTRLPQSFDITTALTTNETGLPTFQIPTVANTETLVNNNPASIDWRTWGGVQRVKNQGSCDSGYAFSAAGALETSHWRKHNTLPDISEQHIIDCTIQYGNGGCSKLPNHQITGWAHSAFKWIQDKGGYIAQNQYPYTGVVGTCQHSSKPKLGQVSNYYRTSTGAETALIDAIANTGTIAVGYNANTPQHTYYQGGILDVPNCGNTPTHMALLIGYGSENGVNYWILKNSWGTSWGESGYFRMKKGINLCGIADWASYPAVA
eukprot:gene5816-7234_t